MHAVRATLPHLLSALFVVVSADIATAQSITGRADSPYGPTTSPYLNLLQNNNQLNTISTYNTLVKPLVDANNVMNRQGNQLNRLQGQVNAGTSAPNTGGSRGATGHTSHFMNYSHYYSRGR